MLVMVRDITYLILVILRYIHHIILSLSLMFFMSHILKKPLLLVLKFGLDINFYLEFHLFVFYVKDPNTKTLLFSDQSKNGIYALTKFFVTSIPQA
jgi:hypothetical protein